MIRKLSAHVTRWRTARSVPLVVLALLSTAAAARADSWVSVKDKDIEGDAICLESDGAEFTYHTVTASDAAQTTIHGPRRMKFVSRYLFAPGEADGIRYTIVVNIDGSEIVRQTLTARRKAGISVCGQPDRAVAALRRVYAQLAPGGHDIAVTATTEGGGRVAVRIFRETRRTSDPYVSFTPQEYAAVYHVQFDSGSRSAYYQLTTDQPVALNVTGPTTLKVYTRLLFDHTMNGSLSYTLEVRRDGEIWREFHFDTEKLSSAVLVERPDLLPGARQRLDIPIPAGPHRIEIRCLRPETCGVCVQIHIPKNAVGRK